MAPDFFKRANEQSAVLAQPQTDKERQEAYRALLACPTCAPVLTRVILVSAYQGSYVCCAVSAKVLVECRANLLSILLQPLVLDLWLQIVASLIQSYCGSLLTFAKEVLFCRSADTSAAPSVSQLS